MNRLRDLIDSFIFHIILRNPREAEDCCEYCEYNSDCVCCPGCMEFGLDTDAIEKEWSND
jgi:hypothetical protein